MEKESLMLNPLSFPEEKFTEDGKRYYYTRGDGTPITDESWSLKDLAYPLNVPFGGKRQGNLSDWSFTNWLVNAAPAQLAPIGTAVKGIKTMRNQHRTSPHGFYKEDSIDVKKANEIVTNIIDHRGDGLTRITPGTGRYDPKVYIPPNELIGTQKGDPLQSVNPDQLKLFDLPRDPYGKEELRVLKENLARKTGYESLAIWKREVLNKWPDKGDQLFRELWKNKQYEGYIEHKIGKASRKLREEDTDSYDMDWYWDKTFIDVDGTTKRGLNKGDRHSITNVRLLFNDRFKNLKDTAEKILYGSDSNPGIGVLNPNLKKRLIIDVEDPMSKQGVGYHTRQNPGDIVIKRAGSGEIIGNLGQYLDFLYPQAKGDQRRLEMGARSLGYKDITAFRTDLIRERINIIVRDTPILLSKPVEERRAFIQETIDNDMQQLAIKYPFLKPQAAIQSQISKDKGMSEKGLTKDRTKKRGGPFKGVTKTEQFNPRQFDWLNDPEYFPDE